MEHCEVDMQVIESAVEEKDGAFFDILTFRCPVCGEEVTEEYPRAAK